MGVGHAHGEHKHDFRAFQTHSFSENQQFSKSTKYKYIFESEKVGRKSKNIRIFEPIWIQNPSISRFAVHLALGIIWKRPAQKKSQLFCVFFFAHLGAFLGQDIWPTPCNEIRILTSGRLTFLSGGVRNSYSVYVYLSGGILLKKFCFEKITFFFEKSRVELFIVSIESRKLRDP